MTWGWGHMTFRKWGCGSKCHWLSQALPCNGCTLVSLSQNTHQSGRQGEDAAGKGAAGALTTPKAEPEELAVSRGGTTVPTEESSSSSEEEELPSSPSPPRPTKRPRRELGSKGIKGGGGGGPGGWTCGLCHSWFPERDEYVAHMKKEHGKVSGAPPRALVCVALEGQWPGAWL